MLESEQVYVRGTCRETGRQQWRWKGVACVGQERGERKASKHWRERGDAVGIEKDTALEVEVEGQKRSSLGLSDMHCRPCSCAVGGVDGCNREGATAEDGQPCNWLVWKQKATL